MRDIYRSSLFSHKNIYDTDGSEAVFLKAVQGNFAYHMANCPEYAALMSQQSSFYSSGNIPVDIKDIPPLPTLFLKNHSLFSIPYEKLVFKATSSGTKGVPSRVGIDKRTAWYAFKMVWKTFAHYGLISPRPTNYIVLGYEPSSHNQMGAVQTAYGTTLAAPAIHREYALKDTGTAYELNLDGIKNALLRYEKQGHPVRFMGFPAYFLFMLESLQDSGIRLKLHPDSKVFLAGGWKQFFTQKVDKQQLYSLAEEMLGISEHSFRDFFGAVEHPIVYCDCEKHHFHVPVYSRVIIRDVKTLQPVPNGTPGLMNLISPLVGSMPLVSIMTDDLAIMHDARECGCKIKSPWFEILGRVGLQDVKTCAAGAAELLGGNV